MKIDDSVFIAKGARIVGDVTIGAYSSVWYNAVLRGDRAKILIGQATNVQDLCIIHGSARHEVKIGDFVTLGHGSMVHGAEVADGTLIGMGAVLMNGSRVGKGSVVAAASVVTENETIPPGCIAMGQPAKVIRELTDEEIEGIKHNALEYKQLASKNRQ